MIGVLVISVRVWNSNFWYLLRVAFSSSLKHMAVFSGLQIFIILLKDKKYSVIYFLNTWFGFLDFVMYRDICTLLSIILPLFCVWEVDFQGFKFRYLLGVKMWLTKNLQGIFWGLSWKFPTGTLNTFILDEPLSERLWLTQNTLLYSLTTHCKIRVRKVGLN